MDDAVPIALRREGETVAGVLLNPDRDETFTAIQGRGAYLDGERLRMSDRAEVGLLAVGTGLPAPDLHSFAGFHARLEAIRALVVAVRIVGRSANSCAHVACGRLAGDVEEPGLVG